MILPDLFEFAYVPNWFDHLSSLAEMAMPESWRFTCPSLPPKNPDTPIGLYLGSGKVVHDKGRDVGVVLEGINQGGSGYWHKCGRCKLL